MYNELGGIRHLFLYNMSKEKDLSEVEERKSHWNGMETKFYIKILEPTMDMLAFQITLCMFVHLASSENEWEEIETQSL